MSWAKQTVVGAWLAPWIAIWVVAHIIQCGATFIAVLGVDGWRKARHAARENWRAHGL